MSCGIYRQLASLLSYPESDYPDLVGAAIAAVPDSCTGLRDFASVVLSMRLEDLQERFTAAFDLNPKGTLDLGWHLFGEKYERGLLLVRMRQQLAKYGIAESSELPDHLTHALLLLGAMQSEHDGRLESNQAADFLGAIVLPALEAIMSAAQESAPYDLLLKAIDSFLRAEFPDVEAGFPQSTLPVLDDSLTHAGMACAERAGGNE